MVTLTGWRRHATDDLRTAVSSEAITVGPCRFGDARQVHALQHRCFRRSLAYRTTTLYSLWAWPRVTFLVARQGSRIVGCVIGDQHENVSRVVSICVDPEAQRQGIGTQLLTAVEHALPIGPMILMVEHTNSAARALYLSQGYIQVGIQRNYYGPGRDGLWMRKERDVTQ
jgi:ribosomal protein S18 acetylase RimI-like enzyme